MMPTADQFDPVDNEQMRRLAHLPRSDRRRLMLNARELAVGLIRGRLRRRYPDLSPTALNPRESPRTASLAHS